MDEVAFPNTNQTLCCLSQANVVKGLKLYQDVFTPTQLSKLLHSLYELREAGRNHQLSGDQSHHLIAHLLCSLQFYSHPKMQGRHLFCSTRTPKALKESLFSSEFLFSAINTLVSIPKRLCHLFVQTAVLCCADSCLQWHPFRVLFKA